MSKPIVHVNKILKLPIHGFGKEGNLIFDYQGLVIILNEPDRPTFRLNEFIKIRIIKVMPTFATAVLVRDKQ